MEAYVVGQAPQWFRDLATAHGIEVRKGMRRGTRPVIVLVGPDVEEPISAARGLQQRAPGATVLLVVQDRAAIRTAMTITPGLGKDLEVLEQDEATPHRVGEILRAAAARRRSGAAVQVANDFLQRAAQLI